VSFTAAFHGVPFLPTDKFVSLAIDGCQQSGFPQGLLQPDLPPLISAHRTSIESDANLQRIYFGPRAREAYLRGPGWGMWITERHIQTLGGRLRVRAEAPVDLIVERPPGMWLQLTPDPFNVTEAQLERLGSYIQPLIPSIEQIRDADLPPTTKLEQAIVVDEHDRYDDYVGPPLRIEVRPFPEDSVPINIHFEQSLTPPQSDALLRTVRLWYLDGLAQRFGDGPFHDMIGPNWQGETARWAVDIGFADPESALQELARRLAGWAALHGARVRDVTVGMEEP